MESPLVSVTINTFNRYKILKKCIESVLSQDYSCIELLVLDNCSSDDTRKYLLTLKDRINIVYVDYPEPNAMKTLNNLFMSATGKYILVLDDDAFMPDTTTITKFVTTMENNPNAGIVAANILDLNLSLIHI